ncbi:MAG TPA: iron-containing redox enzyme family protein [Kofleriaceae bacterium]|nr:iron-containing redox enzyme family protein [Kofleriaceae bacterium]
MVVNPPIDLCLSSATPHCPADSLAPQLAALRELERAHPFWRCRLLAAFDAGALSRDELRYVFSQYHLYSSSFTRFLAAVMASCESDLFRAELAQNLWEEGGGCAPERRHAQIFRNFLHRSLGVPDVNAIEYAPYTRHFVLDYLAQCQSAEPMAAAAFLSLGTEGIVPRMYQIMRTGLRKAGIADDELEFFDLHIACDDEHAETLERLMISYAARPGWFDACAGALRRALDLRTELFDHIFDALQRQRIEPMLARMQERVSLAHGVTDDQLHHRGGDTAVAMYANEVEKLNIEFTVERLPLAAEVLDPRMVRIPPGKFNERHKHAHETLIHILAGTGQVVIDGRALPVLAGDTLMVPRWSMHQTQNLGDTEMRFLAVTDFRLSRRAYLGDATDYRMTADIDAARRAAPAHAEPVNPPANEPAIVVPAEPAPAPALISV